MSFVSDLYHGRTDIDFRRIWKVMLFVSGLLLITSVVSFATQGLNLAIDFRGGAVWEIPADSINEDAAREVLAAYGKEDGAKVQVVTDINTDQENLRIQAESSNDIAESQEIAQKLAERAGVSVTDIGQNTVGPSWGKEITKNAAIALAVFFVVIAMYISWQLEWRMAVSALAAVVHDVVITVGVYSIFQFEVTPATVISFLTILGYSLYDTIVVYDRVRETSHRMDRSGRYTYNAMMRRSLNQVLMRSMNTTIVAILPVISILAIGGVVYGQTVMFDFGLALIVGLVSGAYSSIAIASPLVVWLKEREERYRRIRERARQRGSEAEADWIQPDGDKVAAGPVQRVARDNIGAVKAAQYERAHPPRPRKGVKKR